MDLLGNWLENDRDWDKNLKKLKKIKEKLGRFPKYDEILWSVAS